MHLAVVLGAAVTSAVLTGALLVGDSVRGSLRDLTFERLGQIDFAFISDRFFRTALPVELEADPHVAATFNEIVPAILLRGTATHADSNLRASNVNVQGIDERFPQLFGVPAQTLGDLFSEDAAQASITPLVMNQSLMDELQAQVGDSILISFVKKGAVNPEFLLGSRESADLVGTLRANLVQVLPDSSLGRFSLQLHQSAPRNIFLPLAVLQRVANREGSINALLMAGGSEDTLTAESVLNAGLRKSLSLEDFGLKIRVSGGHAVLESREMVIPPSTEADIQTVAQQLNVDAVPVLTYLANSISSKKQTVPYSTVTALNVGLEERGNLYELAPGQASAKLEEDEILLNEWTAKELGVQVGDPITLTYYVVDWQEALSTKSAAFRLKGIVSMEGLALDQTLTPAIPGVEEAENMASWNPPVPIDLSKIRPVDEEYWEQYRTAPKAFISYEAGVSLWQSRFGRLTSSRFNLEQVSVGELEAALLDTLDPSRVGLLLPVKERGLQAASGATDFGMLFIGFSLFLIVSAVLLVALLFRLGVESRIHEIGLLLSLGFRHRLIRRNFLVEGALLAVLGTLLGLLGGLAYAALLIHGLQTIWVTAIGSSFLRLHVGWISLALGFLTSLLVILGSIFFTFRNVAQLPATSMLAGITARTEGGSGRWAKWVLGGSASLAVVLLATVSLTDSESSAAVFFGLGTCFLLIGLSLFAIWLTRGSLMRINPRARLVFLRASLRNAARNPGRSLLSTVLVGCACFVIVAVGANRSLPGHEIWDRNSGAGGFGIRAESDVALVRDLNDSDALFDLGFGDREIDELQNSEVIAFRLLPGEDMSCRNLYQPGRPRILGVPDAQIARGGFRFQGLESESEEPWSLLNEDLGPGVIPAFGDANSVLWILHKSLGDDVLLKNEQGEEIRLRLVGLLSRSIFQSELLISEANFQKQFPSHSGFSYFLIETQPENVERVSGILENGLGRFGFDAAPTVQVLAGFLAIENTYLATFQMLGGLGLLLGTLGLGIILVRNTTERRGELATLQACGFPRKRVSGMVFNEHCFLLVLGILLGTAAALLAVAPHLAQDSGDVPWLSLTLSLLAILLVGGVATMVAVRLAFRRSLLSELRQE
ncbi:MAG TPA: ABC transporter permease [Acidobacteriota bacterium]|nr:ABC transporter permease [Acidobacteriota bacterium]